MPWKSLGCGSGQLPVQTMKMRMALNPSKVQPHLLAHAYIYSWVCACVSLHLRGCIRVQGSADRHVSPYFLCYSAYALCASMRMLLYMHLRMRMHAHKCMLMYAYAYSYTYAYGPILKTICVCICIRVCARACVRGCICASVRIFLCVSVCVSICVC